MPLDGEAPAQPSNIYGLSKQMSEEMLRYYAREVGMSCVAIRFPFLAQSQSNAQRFRRGLNTERINEVWSYLSMADASALIVAVLRAVLPGFRVYFPAARSNRTGESARTLIEGHFANVPLRRPLESIESLIDVARIRDETAWEPRDEWDFEVLQDGF